MRRSGSIFAMLVVPLLAAGCAPYAYEAGVVYETVRYDAPRASRYYQRVDRDVRGYVRRLDNHLRLSRRQERDLRHMLQNRVYDLLDRTPRADHDRVYPFPRPYGRRTDRLARRWWHETDRRIVSRLTRRQLREYRALTRGDYYDDRYDRRADRY